MSKLTPEFPPHIKPCRPGVYKTRTYSYTEYWYSYWNGQNWSPERPTIRGALKMRAFPSGVRRHWRGLAADPEAK